jgi:CubicO group peptidase (beta-lactamase class C family)
MTRSLVRTALLAAAVLPVFTTAGAQQGDRAALVARIDSLAADHLANGPAASIAVAVVRGSDTIVMRGYGFADLQARRPAGPTTIYEIGSITKQFTSAAIMRLVERGDVSLDADLSTYLPRVPLQGHRVTIRQLLNHTSGIHSYTSVPAWQPHWGEDLSPDSIVGFVARDTFDFAPGTSWRYNNTGYVLLGMVIERVTGKPYATYVDEQFFRPLGLRQATYCPSRGRDTSFAAGYSARNGRLVPAAYLSMTHPFSAGALCSSVANYLVWQRALHGGRVVSPRSYELMTTPDTLVSGTRLTYGFGLMAGQIGGHRMIMHGGGINGFTTAQLYFPAETLSVVAFTNSDAAGPDRTASNIARAVLGMPLVARPVAPPAVPLDAALRDEVIGTYVLALPNGAALPVRIFLNDSTLTAQAEGPGQGPFPLVYHGDSVFGTPLDPGIRLTFVREGGRITKLRLLQGGATIEGPRRP